MLPSAVFYTFVAVALIYRFAMLAVSIRHEKALRVAGAVEYGAGNSKVLALTHVAFYLAAAVEGALGDWQPDALAGFGFAVYLFGAVMLLVVSRLLGRLWTVKLFIAPDHQLVTHPLFRLVRHPNYFLNILPELVGYALTLHAFHTLVVGLPLYLIPLVIRIRQEEAAMRQTFAAY